MPEFDFDEGYERLGRAMTSGSDEIPFIAQMHEFAMKCKGVPGRDFYTDAEVFVRGILETTRDFGFDTPSLIWDCYNIEAEALGAKLVLFDDMAPAIDNVEPIIASEADLARLKTPDPYSAGRMPFVMEVLRLFKELTGQPPAPCYCAPFTLAVQCMTFERLILAIKDDPAYVHKVMTFLTEEVLAPYMNALTAEFPEASVVDGSDATASLPFITQDMLDEFALHYVERLQELCDRPAICDNWWGDSFADDKQSFWEQKLRATPPYFKIQDPDLFKVGAGPAVEFALAKDLPIVMGVDNLVLQRGPAEDIWQRIHEYMEVGGESRKLVLYLCSLSAQTPVENVETAIAAVKAYRRGERPHAGLRLSGAEDIAAEKIDVGPILQVRGRDAGGDEASEQLLDDIYEAVLDYADDEVVALVERGLADRIPVHDMLDDALIAAMDEIGGQFSEGRIFVPEMLLAARAMKAGLAVLRPILTKTETKPKGLIMLATVQGDVHDIGKNLVGMMLEGAGYTVRDLGVNVDHDRIMAEAEEHKPDVVGLSALLTTSMPAMQRTIDAFRESGLDYPIIVGGAPVTQEFADAIGANGYGGDAPGAVAQVDHFVLGKPLATGHAA